MLLVGAGSLFSLLVLMGCSPGPRYVTCDNDAVCRDADPAFKYCSQSHCVECISQSQCRHGMICRAGSCEAR
jgi:hypothetical protein